EARFKAHECRLEPIGRARVRDKRDLKLELAVERCAVLGGVRIDEVAGVGDRKSFFAQKPLVGFHLALVAVVPLFIERLYLFVLARRLVVNDDELALGIDPYVVDGSRYGEAGFRMLEFDALEVLSPDVDVFVLEGHRVYAVVLHDRMRRAVVAVHVELFFEERVHGRGEVERESGRAARAELVVDIEAARALDEERYLAARKAEARASVVPIRVSRGFVVLAHTKSGSVIRSLYCDSTKNPRNSNSAGGKSAS